MNEHFITPELKIRYYTLGDISGSIKNVWIVCHGYGQLAQFFIKKFEDLQDKETLVIAPEGLSKFYLDGFSGKVGATWMTRENRLIEIENYISYLNKIYSTLDQISPHATINVLGFSQGAATACRWVLHQNFKVDHLILWAGEFPPDINKEAAKERLTRLKMIFAFGSEDPFINEERIKTQLDRISELNHNPQILRFNGKHDIPLQALKDLQKIISG